MTVAKKQHAHLFRAFDGRLKILDFDQRRKRVDVYLSSFLISIHPGRESKLIFKGGRETVAESFTENSFNREIE